MANGYGGPNPRMSGQDPRGRLQNTGAYTRGQWESNMAPLMEQTYGNFGRGSEADWANYNQIMQNYRQFGGFGGGQQQQGGYNQGPQQQAPQQQQGPVSQEQVMSMFQGKQITPETLKAMQPQLNQMGIHFQNEARGDLRPRMLMPNGETVDLGAWGGQAQWQPRGNIGDWHNIDPSVAMGTGGGGGDGGGFVGGAGAGGFPSYGGYQEFAKTGGYSPEDIANMRARAAGGVRSAYAGAQREVGRQRALQGGYSPNATAVQAKMAREQGQLTSDAMQNTEAGLAQARNQGRLAGLSGMFGVESLQNQNKLAALSGMSSLYGTSPGMAGTFGNQALEAAKIHGGLGQSQYGHDIEAQKAPGAYEQGMNKVNDVMDIINTGAATVSPWISPGDDGQQRQQTPQRRPRYGYGG
jgi:hypothetical protein